MGARVDGAAVDLSRPLDRDCALDWIRLNSEDGIDILRHSTAHLMAQPVQSLFPGTQVTIGPTIEDGFYYDFKRDQPFTAEEVQKIGMRVAEVAKPDLKLYAEERHTSTGSRAMWQMGKRSKDALS